MTKILPPPFTRAIIDQNGMLTEESRVYFSDLANRIPSYGSGSPEGVVEADLGATYYDIAAVAGSRTYIKISQDIGGDRSQGWELA
jgi:hypothetical protein